MQFQRSAVTTAVGLAAIALTLAACGKGQGAGGAGMGMGGPAEVGYIVVQPQSVGLTTELAGRTSAYLVSDVRPQVGGVIKSRLFQEGSIVHAGQSLYQIDPATYQATYNSAVAALAQAGLDADDLVAADTGVAVGDRPRLGRLRAERGGARLDHDEIVAEAVHLEKGSAHRRLYRG